MTKTVQHPALPWTITYDDIPHTYRDNESRFYTSGTAFVKPFFPPFDAPAAAARVAARTGKTELEILAEWRAKGSATSATGNRVHAYAESLVMGTQPTEPATPRERQAYAMVDKALVGLRGHYELLGAEQIVFDPLYILAGMIDLPARNLKTGALAILDWKTCEDITNDNYGRTGLPPITCIPDSKQAHYMMQLSLYAWLMTDADSGYTEPGHPVELAMIHLPHIGLDPVWRPLPYQRDAIAAMVEVHERRKRGA